MAAIERICTSCGKKFIIRPYDATTEKPDYKFCYSCNRKWREEKRLNREKTENEKWAARKAKEQVEFEEELKHLNTIDVNAIHPSLPLYIIGNGFDLMHGAKSRYRDFSKTLGKNSDLRLALEYYLTDDDIWADFEGALAHLNIDGMASDDIVDMWLEAFDAYNPDGQIADIYAAIDAAASPMLTIADELPKKFRKWVETLQVGTQDRPLQNLFVDGGKVLCFNYTEFVEDLYGMKGVCYIHGSRKRKKGRPKSKLILGHMPGASDEAYDVFSQGHRGRIKNPGRCAMIEMAQDNVLQRIGEYDEDLTKNSLEIIARHADFFDGLRDREDIVVIGHSYSEVDWDYFREIVKNVNGRWYFGCHGLRDLNNLKEMTAALGIMDYSIFRTDFIKVKLDEKAQAGSAVKGKQFRKRCGSKDGRWAVETLDGYFRICRNGKDENSGYNEEENSGCIAYETEFPSYLDRAFFTDDNRHLLILFRGGNPGICVYRIEVDGVWTLSGELESMQYQSLINPRLQHVFVNGDMITFVYNNQERIYSLESAELVSRTRRKYDSSRHYDGADVLERFLKKFPR